MDETEHFRELPKLVGLPGPFDIAQWRAIVAKSEYDSRFELIGIKEGPDGIMVGIFRPKPAG